MRAIFLLYLLLSITSGGLGSLRSPRAPEPPGPGFITPALSKFIQGLILNYDIPGLALAVVHQDGTYEAGGWGKRNEDFDFVTPETLFATGSCSKAFLSTAYGILIDDFAQGRNKTPLPSRVRELSWDTKVESLLPGEWKLFDDWASAKASVRDLLSHSSGLPSHDFSYAPTDSLKDLVQKLRHLKPQAELRQQWIFTNQLYYVVAYIISKYTAGSYAAFVRQRIFDPLNMTSSTFSFDKASKSGKLSQSWVDPGHVVPSLLTAQSEELLAGGIGVISNVADLARWAAAVMNDGVDPHTKNSVIPRNVFEEAKAAQVVAIGAPQSPGGSIVTYGLGWYRATLAGLDVILHDALLQGTSALITLVPSRGIGAVALANVDRPQALGELTRKVLGLPEAGPTPPPSEPGAKPYKDGSDANLAFSLESYAGTYWNAGYGNVMLCAPKSASALCKDAIADFSAIMGRAPAPGLYSIWPRVFSSHLRLLPVSGAKFLAEPVRLFPRGSGKKTTPFEYKDTQAMVEFGVVGSKVTGLALFDVIEKSPERMRAEEGLSLERRADVWFVRV